MFVAKRLCMCVAHVLSRVVVYLGFRDPFDGGCCPPSKCTGLTFPCKRTPQARYQCVPTERQGGCRLTPIQLTERGVQKQESELKFKREIKISMMSVRTHVSSYTGNTLFAD